MVNAGRVACLFTPFALSIASLVCIVLVFLGGTSQGNNTLGDFYFFKADLTNFTLNSTSSDSSLATSLEQAKKSLNLTNYYTVYLWNYCAWSNSSHEYAYCSPKQAEFWFNPVEVWGLNGTGLEAAFPKELTDGLNTYHTVSKYMFIAYVLALVFTVLELVIGISALFSRWGSFVTTLFSVLSTVFIIAASLVATILFATLTGTFNEVLKSYQIHGAVGQQMLRTTWLAVAFSLMGGFFWLLSVCCCSARSPYGGRRDKRVKVEKTPYTYERVGSPNFGARDGAHNNNNMPMNNMGGGQSNGSYEPFRRTQQV